MKKKIIVLFLICVVVVCGATILYQNNNEMNLLSSIEINDIEGVHRSSWYTEGKSSGHCQKIINLINLI